MLIMTMSRECTDQHIVNLVDRAVLPALFSRPLVERDRWRRRGEGP